MDKQNGLQCESWDKWFHCRCVWVGSKEYKLIKELEDKEKWYCSQCEGSNGNLKKVNTELRKCNNELKAMLKQLADQVSKLESKLDAGVELPLMRN